MAYYTMRVSFLLLVLFISTASSGQGTKTITIDTLVGFVEVYEDLKNRQHGWYTVIEGHSYSIGDEYEEIIQLDRFPNVIITHWADTNIFLRLDNKGGVCNLKNIQRIASDTIRIKKWIIYENGLTDTVKGYTGYYRKINDSLLPGSGRFKDHIKYNAHTGITLLNNISVLVNDQTLQIPVTTDSVLTISVGHGHKPKKRYDEYILHRVPDKNYRFKYIATGYDKKYWTFNAEVNLYEELRKN